MELREWALIIFTILGQTAVGTFVVLWVAYLLTRRKAGAEDADRFCDRAFLVVAPVLLLGILMSFAHLGNVVNAPYALTNLGSSWLSREVASSVLFAGAVIVFTFLQWRKLGSFAVRNVVAVITALLGLVLVFSMSQIYMLRTIPVWNHFSTPVSFFAVTFLLGALGAGALLAANYYRGRKSDPACADVQCKLLRQSLSWISLVGMSSMGILVLTSSMQFAYYAAAYPPGGNLLYTNYVGLLVIRLALVILGAGLFGMFLYRAASYPDRDLQMSRLAFSAFALVLVAEFIGRYLFYATFAHIGL